jgi:adenylylsulfate kinase
MSKKTILIMGLPGSGKTTLANELKKKLELADYQVHWYNADEVREKFNDWDFSYDGRLRQAQRMKNFADEVENGYILIDMVAPLPEFREIINPNITIWVDTIEKSRYNDTNKLFIQPENYNFRVTEQDAVTWGDKIYNELHTNVVEFLTLY